jgi:hypothetical protein
MLISSSYCLYSCVPQTHKSRIQCSQKRRQLLGNGSVKTNTHATTQELLGAVFSVRSVSYQILSRSWKKSKRLVLPGISCYLYLSSPRPERLWRPPSLLFNGHGGWGYFPGENRPEREASHLSFSLIMPGAIALYTIFIPGGIICASLIPVTIHSTVACLSSAVPATRCTCERRRTAALTTWRSVLRRKCRDALSCVGGRAALLSQPQFRSRAALTIMYFCVINHNHH